LTQGYRNLLNRTLCNGVGGRASGLQMDTQHYLLTWYNTTAEWDANSWSSPAKVRMHCDMHTLKRTNTAMSEHSVTKKMRL